MEFRFVNDNEKEGIQKQIDLLYDVNGSIDKLVESIYEGRKYYVANGESAVGIVEDNGESLNPYFINIDDPIFQVFGTTEYIYNVVDSNMKEVIKTNGLGTLETRVSYLPAQDNYPRDVIEYSQYIGDINSLLELKYDVTIRKTLESSLAYTYYQLADDIRFQYLKKFGPLVYRKTSYYGRSIDEENVFYSPLIVVRETPYGQKRKTFDGRILMTKFEELGFQKQIPEELHSIVSGTNKEFKTLKLINNEYKKYINGQK